MSFEPPAGILDIGNATLRVGKLEVAETIPEMITSNLQGFYTLVSGSE